MAEPDERQCRICLAGVEEVPELGRLVTLFLLFLIQLIQPHPIDQTVSMQRQASTACPINYLL